MSKIKQLLPEDIISDTRGDEMASIQQDEAELQAYLLTDEAQLSGYTTQQLNDEIFRRMFEPLNTELKRLRDRIDNLTAPF